MTKKTVYLTLKDISFTSQEDFDYAVKLYYQVLNIPFCDFLTWCKESTHLITYFAIYHVKPLNTMLSWSIADLGSGAELAKTKIEIATQKLTLDIKSNG